MTPGMLRTASAAIALSIGLSGCASFDRAAHLDKDTLDAINNNSVAKGSVFETLQQPYLVGASVEVAPPRPVFLERDITLIETGAISLREVAARITEMTGIPVDVELARASGGGGGGGTSAIPAPPASFNGTAIPPPPAALISAMSTGPSSAAGGRFSLRYHGKLSGLLDYVAATTGTSWKFTDGRLLFFDVETRTFEIPALAWQISSKGKIIASAGASADSGGSGGAGTAAVNGANTGSATGSTEIDNVAVSDTWKDLQKVAETVTDGARVFAEPSLGTLTVTGTPAQIHSAEVWVKGLTASLRKQVSLEVHVYTIKLNDEQNYGFSPSVVFNSIGKNYGISATGPSVPIVQSSASPLTFGATVLSGEFNGSSAVAQALATLGSVTQDYEQSAITMNGQPVPIQVGQQTGYLASTSTTQTANVGAMTALTPGFVTTGFTGLFLPRVAGERIMLGMNITISSLLALNTVSNGDSSIQVPTTANSTFQQSVSLPSGSALLLTGFKNNNATTTRNGVFSPFMSLLGGGGDASVSRQLIAIVITARTL